MGSRTWYRYAIVLLTTAAGAGTAHAEEIFVGPGASIQGAIMTARELDTITVEPGFYYESIDLLGKELTLRSLDGPGVTFLGQSGYEPVLRCVNGEGPATVVDGFTIWLGASLDGGGMLNVDSSPTIVNCEFRSNIALNAGGGMSNRNSSPTVTDCTFRQNQAQAGPGGGMYNDATSSPRVSGCSFVQNNAMTGGAVHNDGGAPTFTNCTITNNNAGQGGGVFIDGGAPTLTDCFLGTNFVSTLGGGVYIRGGGTPAVINCRVVNNFADQGAGLFVMSTDALVAGCLFTHNQAQTVGGGIYTFNGDANITNCTITANCANTLQQPGGPFGAGLYNLAGAPTIANCIIWDNRTGAACGNPAEEQDPPEEIGGAGITVSYSNVKGGWPGTGNIGDLDEPDPDSGFPAAHDPQFADPDGPDDIAANQDDDLRPRAGSVCVDAGRNDDLPADVTDVDGDGDFVEPLPLDIEGNPRVTDTCSADQGADFVVDMGAYETEFGALAQSRLYVDAAAAPGGCGGAWSDAFTEVYQALEVAATTYGIVDEIWVAEGTYRPTGDTERTRTLRLLKGLEVYGAFPAGGGATGLFDERDPLLHATILSGDIGVPDDDTDNSFHVITATGTDDTTVIDGLRITAGHADHTDVTVLDGMHGGGMLVGDGAPIVTNCTFYSNKALAKGGAVYASAGSAPAVTNCSFFWNLADSSTGGGGAIYVDSGGSVALVNNTLYANDAGSGAGGAFYSSFATVTVKNCILWENLPDQFAAMASPPTVTYSNVEASGGSVFFNNIDVDPDFVGRTGSPLPDLRLNDGSPCVDVGNDAAVPADVRDVDGDGDTTEPLPDLDGLDRIVDGDDDQVATVDMGAYEWRPPPPSPDTCHGDIDVSGDVGFGDILAIVASWGPCPGCPADLDDSGDVGFGDILVVIAAWGPC